MTDRKPKPILYYYKNQKFYYTSQNKCCKCLNITNKTLTKYLFNGIYKKYKIQNIKKIPKQTKHKNEHIKNIPKRTQTMILLLEYYDKCENKNDKEKIYYNFINQYKNKKKKNSYNI